MANNKENDLFILLLLHCHSTELLQGNTEVQRHEPALRGRHDVKFSGSNRRFGFLYQLINCGLQNIPFPAIVLGTKALSNNLQGSEGAAPFIG
jgi:hypothetical protein